jgi:predicted  nucleic acid-binding Zn-ribbon protein
VKVLLSKEDDINKEIGKLNKIQAETDSMLEKEAEGRQIQEDNEESEKDKQKNKQELQKDFRDIAKRDLQMEDSEITKYQKIFDMIDEKNTGSITKEEFFEVLSPYRLKNEQSEEELDRLFHLMENDCDGKINFLDFLKAVHQNPDKALTNLITYFLKQIEPIESSVSNGLKDKPLAIDIEEEPIESSVTNGLKDRPLASNIEEEPLVDQDEKVKMEPIEHGKEIFTMDDYLNKLDESEKNNQTSTQEVLRNLEMKDEGSKPDNQEESKIKEMEKIFQKEISSPKTTIPCEERIIEERDYTIESKDRENQELLITKQKLEEKLNQIEKEFFRLREEHEMCLKEKVPKVTEEKNFQRLFGNLPNENEINTGMQDIEAIRSSQAEILDEGAYQDFKKEIESLNKLLESVMKEKNRVEKEKKSLCSKVEDLERERSQLSEDLTEVKKDIEIVYLDENQRRQEIENLSGKLKESVGIQTFKVLKKERDALSRDNLNLKNKIEVLRKNCDALEEEKKKLEAQIKNHEVERVRLIESCDHVNDALKAMSKEFEELEQREKDYLKQINSLKKKTESSLFIDEEFNTLKKENEFLKDEMVRRDKLTNEKLQSFDPEEAQLLREFEIMREEMQNMRQKEKGYQQRLNEALNNDLKQHYDKLVERTNLLEKENDCLIKKNKELNENAKSSEKEKANLFAGLNQVEFNLKKVQQRENESKLKIQEVDQEIRQYSFKSEKLKIDNSVLRDQVDMLSKEVVESKLLKFRVQEANTQLLVEVEKLKKELQGLIDERNKYQNQLQILKEYDSKALKNEYEIMKFENRTLKLRNLGLENRMQILEREVSRKEEIKRNEDKWKENKTLEELKSFNEKCQELKRENQLLNQQIEGLKQHKDHVDFQKESSHFFTPTKFEKSMKENKPTYTVTKNERGFQQSLEKLREELKHVRESREEIMKSLEKDKHVVRNILGETPKTTKQLYYSLKETPNTLKQYQPEKVLAFEESGEGVKEESTEKKKHVSLLTNRSALETIKKVYSRPIFVPYQSLSGKKMTQPSYDIHETKSSSGLPFERDESKRDLSKVGFQILYWLTDNALLIKELCTMCDISTQNENIVKVQQILEEVRDFTVKAKSDENKLKSKDPYEESKIINEFVLPLFDKCIRCYEQLNEIQNKVVDNLKEVSKERKTSDFQEIAWNK